MVYGSHEAGCVRRFDIEWGMTMTFRYLIAGAMLAGCVLGASSPQAATITSSLAAWQAAVGPDFTETTSTGLPLFTSPVNSVTLGDGMVISLAGTADTVLQPLSGWFPWSNGYTGDIIDTTTNSETISFPSSLSALGFQVSPDLSTTPGAANPETFTVTLSDGTTMQINGTYPPDISTGTVPTQFIGFFGGGITSITVTTQNAPDFALGDFVDVPEPISLSVFAGGIGALGLVRRGSRRGRGA
jgi:hypothetical protein